MSFVDYRAGSGSPSSLNDLASDPLPADSPARRRLRYYRTPRARLLGLPAAWPLVALLVGYPVWWLLGIGSFAFLLFASVMAAQLARRRPIKVPPGFGLWLLYLAVVVASVVMLGQTAPGTIPGDPIRRLLPYSWRLACYLALTVILLYVGNLSQRELSQIRLVKLLGWFGVVAIGGGLLGVVWPTFSVTSPVERLFPRDSFLWTISHPASAQIQDILGYAVARPKAPFEYANDWGNNVSILIIWLIVGWWVYGSRWQRLLTAVALGVAVVPIVYSLNRGLWIGIAISLAYVAIRLAARGRLLAVGVVGAAFAVAAILVFASPLGTLIEDRMAHGHSNDVRSRMAAAAVTAAAHSPVLGYGSTRAMIGSSKSIAVGKTPNCPRCGNEVIGTAGHLWLMLIATGFAGTALYIGFFAQGIWRYGGDHSPIGLGGVLVLVLMLWYMFVYQALVSPLALTFLSLALLWRNDMLRKAREPDTAAKLAVRPVTSVVGRPA